MATGEYNVSHLQLPSDKMGDQCDGLTLTCQVDWVNATTLIVTKHKTSLQCELVESEKTGAIKNLSMADINEETLPEIVNTTKAVLRENTTTSALDVILVANILDNAIRLSNIPTETATDLLEIVEIVAGLNQTVLEQSNTADNATNRVLQAVESLGDRVSLGDAGSARIQTNSTVLQVWNLTTVSDSHVLGLDLALDSGDVTDITDGQGRGNRSEGERKYDNTDTAIMLPGKMGRSIVEKYPGQDIRISASIFTKSSLFRSSAGSHVTDADSRHRHATLNSKVIALRITVDGQPKTNLTAFGKGSVTTVFTPVQSLSKEQSFQRELSTCVFWDFAMQDGKGAWSEEGCNYSDTVQGKVVCECDHLTNFAVLLDLYGQESRKEKIAQIHESALSLISKIGLSLSIAGLSVTVISFIVIKKLHSSNSQQTLFNLALALLLSWVTFLAGFSRGHGHVSCVLVAALLHYLILVSFMWMVIEGILLFLQFKARVGRFSRYMLKTALPAWGLPLIPVIITLSIDVNLYNGGEQYCWMSRTPFYYAFLTPIAIMVSANIVLYVLIVVSICRRRDMSHGGTSYNVISIRASIASFVVLGLSWVFAFFAIEDARLVFQYLFTCTAAFQGILIFAIFTARDAAVRQFWLDLICKQVRRGLPWSRLVGQYAPNSPATKETSFSRSS
ncbi:adhesion G-protein coupled receptor G6-like [Littorina saxatilis]|uniref:adhesion G-protein coupled receptor G6-like n=1 Tax=Littorina saxatilis TaxID=31220 RepID=UPI0038B64678